MVVEQTKDSEKNKKQKNYWLPFDIRKAHSIPRKYLSTYPIGNNTQFKKKGHR